MELKTLDTFINIAKSKPKKYIAVAAAEDEPVLSALQATSEQGIAEPILIGDKTKVRTLADKIGFNLDKIRIIDEPDASKAAKKCVEIIRNGEAHILMKGLISTADFLKAVLDRDVGLRKGALLSHIGFFETKAYHKLIAVTDAAQNIAPDLSEKVSIISNSADFYNRLGVKLPKIALIASVETVNPKMPVTLDYASITMMNRRGQIKNCIVDGPLAFDNAVSKEAAEHKGIISEVAGDVDLLFMPNIEAANAIYKSLTFFGGATVAAVILGAAVPIVLTSRSDSDRSKFMSIALAASF